jgi:hypothetical protein
MTHLERGDVQKQASGRDVLSARWKVDAALVGCAWFTASAADAAVGETLLIAATQSASGKKEGQSEALPPPSFSKPGVFITTKFRWSFAQNPRRQ